MLGIAGKSFRRSSRRCGHALGWVLAAAAATATPFACSIYAEPDGPGDLESGGSSGSGNAGGTASSGGSKAAGGSVGSSGSAGASEGGSGDGSGGSEAGGSETGSGGSETGAGGSGGSQGGSTSSGGATGGDGGSSAGTNGTGGAGGSGGASAVVELALNKPAFGSSDQAIYTFAHGNDGDVATRWSSVERTFPQHWIVDLGESHELSSFEVTWESEFRAITYEVATSEDNAAYVVQITRTQTGRLQTGPMLPGATGRYVRVLVTNAAGSAWPSFFEFKVFGK